MTMDYQIAVARPGETTDIQAISTNDFTLFVSWSPPSNTNGVVISETRHNFW